MTSFKSFSRHVYVLPLSRWLLCTYYLSGFLRLTFGGGCGFLYNTCAGNKLDYEIKIEALATAVDCLGA